MAFRMRVNGKQLFGNNICYDQWTQYLLDQGFEIDEDGNFDGYLTDFDGALHVLESIVMDLESQRENQAAAGIKDVKSLFDLSDIKTAVTAQNAGQGVIHDNLFDQLFERVEYGFLFLPLMFYECCRDMLEYAPEISGATHRIRSYKLKEGCRIHVHGG